ncbi:hypothetical protein LLS1_24040 [Leifsonia sp. LS1]|nr:hypothetical protein LLS1_24040 [Leifsonia sp. LS1]
MRPRPPVIANTAMTASLIAPGGASPPSVHRADATPKGDGATRRHADADTARGVGGSATAGECGRAPAGIVFAGQK